MTRTPTEPPWVRFARMRRSRGISQRALAKGLVTQSLVSQLERGRVVPSRWTLAALLQRLGVEDDDRWLDEWEAWRRRDSVRERLWRAVSADDGGQAEAVLREAGTVLHPFELRVYQAWVCARLGEIDRAEQLLWEAWSLRPDVGQARTAYARASHQPLYEAAKRPEHGHEAAWRHRDRVRAMAASALAQAAICEHIGRRDAVDWWRSRGQAWLGTKPEKPAGLR
ncbi:helix-turn-helix transcriptional regulator [Alicyclobacillus sp.]|uniref:helix-turn-helix domain-containing protein n=1 Tax=Alicyclobacillus sp. TaxID=61169 RepID=UPI0025BB8AD1|nr:helix-turn-helix transcriptional regulator [Alicyclobacillus sp.]MCL6516677.1 helix-turn-helix domain-containing protein [Alicyclobacillus sp.]